MNRKKLVDLLAEKTGREKTEVEKQLVLFMDQLKSELAKGEDFKVSGLGTFSMEGDDIVFLAEEKLSTEVNYKYAGMKPIELIGAYKETPHVAVGSSPEEESASEPVPGVEEYSEEMDTVAEEEQVTISEAAAEEKETVTEDDSAERPPKELEMEQPEREARPQKPVEESPKPAAAAKTTSSVTAPSKKGYRSKRKKDSTDYLGKLLVAAVVIIAIGISGWMFYDLGYFGGSSGSESDSSVSESRVGQNLATVPEQQANTGENKTAADTVTNKDTAADDKTSEQDESNSTSSITSIAEASRQSVYGLRGGASPTVEDGYTIVVHSLRDEVKVRRLNEELQQAGYRTVISRASIMDTTFWRLGLGRFKTIDDAQNASQTLPDPYKSNYFIKRIQ